MAKPYLILKPILRFVTLKFVLQTEVFPKTNLLDAETEQKLNEPLWNGLSLAIFQLVLVQRTARLRASTRFVYSMIYGPQSLILMIATTSSRF